MRTAYSIKNSITSFISNVINVVFLFVTQTLFIKILGIEYAGLNGLFSNVLAVLSLLELGMGNAIVYNLYKYVKDNDISKIKSIMKYHKKVYNYVAVCILLLGLILLPFIKFFIKEVTVDINIYITYLLFLISTVSSYFISYKRNLLFAYQRNYIINIIHIVYIVILNIIQILILYLTKNYYLYLIVKIICIILENIIINIKVNKDYKYILDKDVIELDKNTKNDIISRVKALFIHKTSTVVTHGTDNILISSFFGLTTLGLYTNYYYVIQTINTLFLNIITSTSASVGNLLLEKDCNKNYLVFSRIRFLNYWIAVVTSICLYYLMEPFITLWLGSEYLLTNIVLIALIINYFQRMMRNTYIVFKDAAGIWIEDKYIPIIQIVINLISSIILLKLIGLSGVFIGTILSSLVLWLYSYPKFVYKKLFDKNYGLYYFNLFKSVFLAVIIFILTSIPISFICIDGILGLIVKLLICLVIPNIIFFIIYFKNENLIYYKKLIEKKKV